MRFARLRGEFLLPVGFITIFCLAGELDLGPTRTGPWSNTGEKDNRLIWDGNAMTDGYFTGDGCMPALSAILTRSATDWAPIFFMMDAL